MSKRQAYNQLELFVGSFPGNCYTLKEEYDRFLTLSDAAMCLMYKERVLHSEETPLKIYYTDRQGVPVAIDITGKVAGDCSEFSPENEYPVHSKFFRKYTGTLFEVTF